MCISRGKIKLWKCHLIGFYTAVLSNLGFHMSVCINLKKKTTQNKKKIADKRINNLKPCKTVLSVAYGEIYKYTYIHRHIYIREVVFNITTRM